MKNWLKYLFVFYILLCSTGIAMAQYVTIGGANGTTAYLMRTWTEDGKSQLTFSNNILNWGANILTVGDTIYSIGWNVQSVGGQVMYNANINIIESGSATSVWAGKLAPIIGWNDILLDVPYVRTGTGNLIVEYCFDNCNQTSTTDVYRTQTSTNTFAYRTGNNANGCSYTPNQQNTVNRPNTRFGKSVPGATYTHDTICSGTSITLSSNSSLTLNTSISGFTYHGIWNGNYYFQSNNFKTWLAADLHCQSAGGHLVHIDNAAENTHVSSIINGTRWIGYYQNCNSGLLSEPAGGFEWTDGTIGTYTNWDVGNNQPNNGTSIGEEYTMMYTSGIWHDYNATTTRDYVMEIEETYLWNTGDITSTITVSPTTTTTYWVDHSFGTNTVREYFIVQSLQVQFDSLIAAPIPVCFGDTVTLTAYPSSSLYEYEFMWAPLGTTPYTNITSGNGWGSNNPITYPIYQGTDFKLRIRNSINHSCITPAVFSTVPVNLLPSAGPIWHN
jgi:hypothetical protein